MSKNIKIKHHDGTNWVELFPKTVASIVELNNGQNVQAVVTSLINDLEGKVDKVSGKQLTTNDFTNTLKNKLDGLKDHSSEINNLQSNKADKSTTYTKSEVDTRINNLQANAIPVSTKEPTGASVWFQEL